MKVLIKLKPWIKPQDYNFSFGAEMSSKSATDVYSEIIEKSYSVKSLSNESLCLDDDEALANELLRKMDAPVVSKLRRCFRRRKPSGPGSDIARDLDRKVVEAMRQAAAEEGIEFSESSPVPRHKRLWADEELFVSSLEKIFGNHKYTTHAHKLFRILDPFFTKLVWWSDLLDRLVQEGARRTSSRAESWTPVDGNRVLIEGLQHCKKETIVKIISVATTNTFCYVVTSKGGKVGAYDGRMTRLMEYDIFYARSGQHRRVKSTWITDAIYLNDTKSLVFSASDRSLTIYDSSTLTHFLLYIITGIPNIPTCLTYEESQNKGDISRLFFGDDHGRITILELKQPRLCLFYKKHTDRANEYFWKELQSSPHDSYCEVTVWKKMHVRSVRRIHYCRRFDAIISCSNDPDASVVIRHRPGKIDNYVFKVLRGVSCFHMSASLRVLATGSADGKVRLWDPVLTLKPFAEMDSGHRRPLVDVAVIAHLELVLALNKNATVDIWDIYEESCLQKIKIRYPFIGILGKRVEYGAYCLHPGPKRRNSTEDTEVHVPIAPASRRGSYVFMAEDGALKLDRDEPTPTDHYCFDSKADSDPEHSSWNRVEFLVTCCDHVAVVHFNPPPLHPADRGGGVLERSELPSPLPPPDRTTRERRPSIWDNVELAPSFRSHYSAAETPRAGQRSPSSLGVGLLKPEAAVCGGQTSDHPDLDVILEQAGISGILEKDFSLMMGLKHDLNRKLNELKSKQEMMKGPVSQCAPYIALDLHELQDISFSQPLQITGRMKKRSGLQMFLEPSAMLNQNSCFNMSSPRSTLSASSRPSNSAGSTPRRTRK